MNEVPMPRDARAWPFLRLAPIVFCLACASGSGMGGAPMGQEAARLFAAFGGRWELNSGSSTPQVPNEFEGMKDEAPVSDIARNESREMRRYRRMVESRRVSIAHMRTTVDVLRRRPETLVLRLDGSELRYTPIPGNTLIVPMDGSEVEAREGEHRVRTKLGWQDGVLHLEHHVVSGGRVREVIEVVGDRLVMTRTLVMAGADRPLVLAYDRG